MSNKIVNERYQEHIDGVGSFWTKKYKPLYLIKKIENSSPFDEDRYVKEYMAIYGIENVRGGSYNQEELNNETIKFLRNELRTSNNECYKCGSTSHFVNECDYISIDDYIELFINNLNSIECLDREIYYLKDVIFYKDEDLWETSNILSTTYVKNGLIVITKSEHIYYLSYSEEFRY